MSPIKRSRIVQSILYILMVCGSVPVGVLADDPAGELVYPIQALIKHVQSGQVAQATSFYYPGTPPESSTAFSLSGLFEFLPSASSDAATKGEVVAEKAFWGLSDGPADWGKRFGGVMNANIAPQSPLFAGGYLSSDIDLLDCVMNLHPVNLIPEITILGVLGQGVLLGTNVPAKVATTGVTVSDSNYDDGFHQAGVPLPDERFIIPGDAAATNCVIDTLTGLMWVRTPEAITMNQSNAAVYCQALDGEDGRGGFADWRLPTLRELESLAVYGNDSSIPFIAGGEEFFTFSAVEYWTSTPYMDPDRDPEVPWGWLVNFGSRSLSPRPVATTRRFRPVRGPIWEVSP